MITVEVELDLFVALTLESLFRAFTINGFDEEFGTKGRPY
jgi:hypothetical protein